MTTFLKYAAVAVVMAAPVTAQTWSENAPHIGPIHQPDGILLHPYATAENYCPSGLRPITVGGVISCGKSNTGVAYYNRASFGRFGGYTCRAGIKGCD